MRAFTRGQAATLTRLLITALACTVPCATAHGKAPERAVTGTAVISAHEPALRIERPATAQYVGAARWDLYGMADCELHVFVEADARKSVERPYRVQFESRLPTAHL
ncbi:hypothetical protein [Nevskia soli]|uniref:hypothetical protein n=1 Tax=Nevskia soli TaxID=418856 RepID=UPI0004A6C2E5|nr:hypothetical protein [Nevskia soli]